MNTRTNAQRRLFDFEKLDVYWIALAFYETARAIISDLPRDYSEERNQLRRAALSILLNLCEGIGEFSPQEKIRFFRMSLRSCTECAALMRIFERDFGESEDIRKGVEQLHRIIAMVTAMINKSEARAK